ncbi:hypothetical protein [Thermostichus sp. MS-CIW-41]
MSRRQLTISVSSVALVVATGMLLLLLWQLRSLVLTVMIAVVVAAALAPLVDLAERLRIPRWLGVVLVYLSLIAGIAGLALLIGPTVVQPVKGSRGTIAALSKPTSEGGWIDQ